MSKKDEKQKSIENQREEQNSVREELKYIISKYTNNTERVEKILNKNPGILTTEIVRLVYEEQPYFVIVSPHSSKETLDYNQLIEAHIISYFEQIDRSVITVAVGYADTKFINSCLEKGFKFPPEGLKNVIINVLGGKLDNLEAKEIVKKILAQGVSPKLITEKYLAKLEQKKLEKILLYIKIATHISNLVWGSANDKDLKSKIKKLEKLLKHESIEKFVIECFNSHLNNLLKENNVEALNKFKSKLINNDLLIESENKDSLIKILFKNSVLKIIYKDIKSFVTDDRSLQYNEKNLEKKANDTITLSNSTTDAVNVNNFADLKNLLTDNESSTEDAKASAPDCIASNTDYVTLGALISDVENQ